MCAQEGIDFFNHQSHYHRQKVDDRFDHEEIGDDCYLDLNDRQKEELYRDRFSVACRQEKGFQQRNPFGHARGEERGTGQFIQL